VNIHRPVTFILQPAGKGEFFVTCLNGHDLDFSKDWPGSRLLAEAFAPVSGVSGGPIKL
jgi:hypothetical protein